jgi:hypothetical protein
MPRAPGKKRVPKAPAPPDESESSCPFFADWDRSPEGKQKRADEVRATIPGEIAAQVQGWFVSELSHSFCQWEGSSAKPRTKMQLDEAVYRLANVHPFGIYRACIMFENGAWIRFSGRGFVEFTPAPSENGPGDGTGHKDAAP